MPQTIWEALHVNEQIPNPLDFEKKIEQQVSRKKNFRGFLTVNF